MADTKHEPMNVYARRFDSQASVFEQHADFELSMIIQQWWASAFDDADKGYKLAYSLLASFLNGAIIVSKMPLKAELSDLWNLAKYLEYNRQHGDVMNKDQFIAFYCSNSGKKWDDLKKHFVALPCNCGDESCHGWAMVSNDEFSIEIHNELYGEKEKK